MWLRSRARGEGISSTISMSKTRKITARRKNRVENGIRAFLFGSKPHSNGEAFSRSFVDFALKINARSKTIGGRIMAIENEKREIIIYKGY